MRKPRLLASWTTKITPMKGTSRKALAAGGVADGDLAMGKESCRTLGAEAPRVKVGLIAFFGRLPPTTDSVGEYRCLARRAPLFSAAIL